MTTEQTPDLSRDRCLSLGKSGETLPHGLDRPCTRCERTPVCQLLSHLHTYNRALRYIGFELKEDVQDSIGDVRLVTVSSNSMLANDDKPAVFQNTTMAVFHRLLKQHRCIVAVDLADLAARIPSLHVALKNNSNLRRISFLGKYSNRANDIQSTIKLFASMVNVEDLVFTRCQTFPLFSMGFLFLLLRHGPLSLRTLDVAGVEMNDRECEELFAGLMKNNTIKELTISFTSGLVEPVRCFAEYLTMKSTTLKTLTLSIFYVKTPVLQFLVKAISTMTTLEELNVDLWPFTPQNNVLFARVVSCSRILRTLSVTWRWYNSVWTRPSHLQFPASIDPWALAVCENSVLRKLTIDLFGFGVDECCSFFRALENNKSLEHISVRNLPGDGDIRQICHTIQKTGLTKRVFIKNLFLTPADLTMLHECPEVTAVAVLSSHEILKKTFATFASINHITSLWLTIYEPFLDDTLHIAMAEYIAGASTLEHLYLHIAILGPAGHGIKSECRLIEVFSSNLNLKKSTLYLDIPRLSDKDSRLLANSALHSRKLYDLTFYSWNVGFEGAFLHSLASGIKSNYTLLRVMMYMRKDHDTPYNAVQDVISRNCSLVTRAAHFVLGNHDAFGARALELVSDHPRLEEIIQEQAGIGTTEAAKVLRRALSHPCFTSLHGYMKLTGVVKHLARCCNRRGARTQLNNLDDYCWLQIRKYLSVADVPKA